jgi:spore germination protein KB
MQVNSMRKQIISGGQLVGIMFWSISGTAIITLPTLIAIHAPRDAWTAALFFFAAGSVMCLLVGALARRLNGRDFVSLVQQALGIWPGKLLLIIFLVWLFHTISFIIWQMGSFISLSLLPNAPFTAVLIVIILPPVYAVYKGIEDIARCGQIIFIPTTLTLLLLLLLHIPEVNPENLMPILGDGISNILQAGFVTLPWAGEIVLVLFLVPYLKDSRKTARFSFITVSLIGFGGLIGEIFYTAVFGPLLQHLINPFYAIVRYIRPTAFIERYDIFFVAIILFGSFIKISLFIYIFVLCLSRVLGMTSHRPLVLPSSAGLIVLACYSVKSLNHLLMHMDTVFPVYTTALLFGFPLLVLLVAKIRGIK